MARTQEAPSAEWLAEGARRRRDDRRARPVMGRNYTVQERVAIGMMIGAPGPLATVAEIHQWQDEVLAAATKDAVATMYRRISMEVDRLLATSTSYQEGQS